MEHYRPQQEQDIHLQVGIQQVVEEAKYQHRQRRDYNNSEDG